MCKIKKIHKRVSNFFFDLFHFGLWIAVTNALWPLIFKLPRDVGEKIMQKKHKSVFLYINKIIGSSLKDFYPLCDEVEYKNDAPIWFCWLQGEVAMPDAVKICYKAIQRNSNGHSVNLITNQNYFDYCSIPDYIVKLHKNNKILPAHFADILRTCLLYEHGGVWVDATLLITKPLPKECFSSNFYSCKLVNQGLYVSEFKWSNFFLCSPAHSPLFAFVRICFFEYLKKQNRFVDYFMMDYFMKLGMNTSSIICNDVERLAYNNPQVHSLSKLLNTKCSEKEFMNFFKQETYAFKLLKFVKVKKNADSSKTFFDYLQSLYLI